MTRDENSKRMQQDIRDISEYVMDRYGMTRIIEFLFGRNQGSRTHPISDANERYCIIDCSTSMTDTVEGDNKFSRGLMLSLIIERIARKSGLTMDFACITDEYQHKVSGSDPTSMLGHIRTREGISSTSWSTISEHIEKEVRPDTPIMIISDFMFDPNARIVAEITATGRIVNALQVLDDIDEDIPERLDRIIIKSPGSENAARVKIEKSKQEYKLLTKEYNQYLKEMFTHPHTGFFSVRTSDDPEKNMIELLTQARVIV